MTPSSSKSAALQKADEKRKAAAAKRPAALRHRLFSTPQVPRSSNNIPRSRISAPRRVVKEEEEEEDYEEEVEQEETEQAEEEVMMESESDGAISVDFDQEDAYACYEGSAAHRVLSNLHALDPRVPITENPYQQADWKLPRNGPIAARKQIPLDDPIVTVSQMEAKEEPSVVIYSSNDGEDDEDDDDVIPDIVHRKEVLPQTRRLRVGDYVTVRQRDVEVGAGRIAQQLERSVFVVESDDHRYLWTARSSQLFRSCSGPHTDQPSDTYEDVPKMHRRKLRKKRIRTVFMSCVNQELRQLREKFPNTPLSPHIPPVNMNALARSIAMEHFQGTKPQKTASALKCPPIGSTTADGQSKK